MRTANFSPDVQLLARILGVAGSVWGLAVTVVMTAYFLSVQSGPHDDLWPVIRLAVGGVVLYGACLFCVLRGYRPVLTLLLVLIIPLNFLGLASVGILLLPGTALLTVATVLFGAGVMQR